MTRYLLPLRRVGLTMFLLIHAIGYSFINWIDYIFVPVHEALHVGLVMILIIVLTIDGIRCRNERTEFSSIVNAILPLIALFFVVTIMIVHGSDLYGLLAMVTLVCSLVLFFACTQNRVVKLLLGMTYVLVLVIFPMFILLWSFMIVTSPPGITEVRQTELSPNGIYLSEVIEYNGADGVTRWIVVTPQNRDINILLGVFRPVPQRIHTAHGRVSLSMTLYWETDEILQITHTTRDHHTTTLHFERQGRNWVQR